MELYLKAAPGRFRSKRTKWQTMQRKVEILKLRYTNYINPEYPKEEWSFE